MKKGKIKTFLIYTYAAVVLMWTAYDFIRAFIQKGDKIASYEEQELFSTQVEYLSYILRVFLTMWCAGLLACFVWFKCDSNKIMCFIGYKIIKKT